MRFGASCSCWLGGGSAWLRGALWGGGGWGFACAVLSVGGAKVFQGCLKPELEDFGDFVSPWSEGLRQPCLSAFGRSREAPKRETTPTVTAQ